MILHSKHKTKQKYVLTRSDQTKNFVGVIMLFTKCNTFFFSFKWYFNITKTKMDLVDLHSKPRLQFLVRYKYIWL